MGEQALWASPLDSIRSIWLIVHSGSIRSCPVFAVFVSGQAFAEVRCVGERISMFHSLELLLCQVKAAFEVTLVLGIAHQELSVFSFLDG